MEEHEMASETNCYGSVTAWPLAPKYHEEQRQTAAE